MIKVIHCGSIYTYSCIIMYNVIRQQNTCVLSYRFTLFFVVENVALHTNSIYSREYNAVPFRYSNSRGYTKCNKIQITHICKYIRARNVVLIVYYTQPKIRACMFGLCTYKLVPLGKVHVCTTHLNNITI